MHKNKLNLHTYGIHLLNPYKTVVSHLNINLAFWVKMSDISEHSEFDYPPPTPQKNNKILGPRSWRSVRTPWPLAKYFSVQPDLT